MLSNTVAVNTDPNDHTIYLKHGGYVRCLPSGHNGYKTGPTKEERIRYKELSTKAKRPYCYCYHRDKHVSLRARRMASTWDGYEWIYQCPECQHYYYYTSLVAYLPSTGVVE